MNPDCTPASESERDCPFCAERIKIAAIVCKHCGRDLASPPEAPPPQPIQPALADAPKAGYSTPVKLFAWAAGIVLFLFFIGLIASSTPEGKAKINDRLAIDECWKDQARKSHDPGTARFVAQVCEKMEAQFITKHGSRP